MSGFQVDPSELHSFAGAQHDRQQALEAAASKASGVSLGGDTFGVLLQFFADSAEESAQKAVEAIHTLASAVGAAADDTRSTARTYESQEDANQDRFGGGR